MGLSNQNLSISQSPPHAQTYVLVPATEILSVNKTKTQKTITQSRSSKAASITAGILATVGTGSYFFYKNYSAKIQPVHSGLYKTMTGLFFITFCTGIASLAYKTKLCTVRYSPSQINPPQKLNWDIPSKMDTLDDLSSMIEHLDDFHFFCDTNIKTLNMHRNKYIQACTSLLLKKLSKINTANKSDVDFFGKLPEVFENMQFFDDASIFKLAHACLSIQSNNEIIKETRTSIKNTLQNSDLGISFVIDCIEKNDKSDNYQEIIDERINYFFHQTDISQQLEFLKKCAKLNSQKHFNIQETVLKTFFHLYCCYDKTIDKSSLEKALMSFLEAKNDQMVRLFLLACEHLYRGFYDEMYTLAYNSMKNNPKALATIKTLTRPKKIIETNQNSLETSLKAQTIKNLPF